MFSFQTLKKYGVDNLETAFRKAAADGDVDALEHILDENPQFNINAIGPKSGFTALHFAIKNITSFKKKAEAVQYLLEQGSNPNLRSETQTTLDLIDATAHTDAEKKFLKEMCNIKIEALRLSSLLQDTLLKNSNEIQSPSQQKLTPIIMLENHIDPASRIAIREKLSFLKSLGYKVLAIEIYHDVKDLYEFFAFDSSQKKKLLEENQWNNCLKNYNIIFSPHNTYTDKQKRASKEEIEMIGLKSDLRFDQIMELSKLINTLQLIEYAKNQGFKIIFHDPRFRSSLSEPILQKYDSSFDVLAEEGMCNAINLAAEENEGGVISTMGLGHGANVADRFNYFYHKVNLKKQILLVYSHMNNVFGEAYPYLQAEYTKFINQRQKAFVKTLQDCRKFKFLELDMSPEIQEKTLDRFETAIKETNNSLASSSEGLALIFSKLNVPDLNMPTKTYQSESERKKADSPPI